MSEFKVTVTWGSLTNNPDTIWNRLAAKLGREPTNAEAIEEVKRLLAENSVDRAAKGKLRFQRGWI